MLKYIAFAGASLLALLAALAFWIDARDSEVARIAEVTLGSASPGAIYSTKFIGADGTPVSLGRWADKLLILNFWATWCAPCKEEIPVLNNIQQRFGPGGVQIVGIAADSSLNVTKFSRDFPIDYPTFADEGGAIELSKRLGNRLGLLPFSVVVQPGGNVLMVRMGAMTAQEFEEIVDKNLPKAAKSR